MRLELLIPFWGLASYTLDTKAKENRALLLLGLAFYNYFFGFLVMKLLGL